MALWDLVKNQLRSVIQWEPADKEALFELWSEHGDEIKNASKLIVGPGQGVIFVYQGRVESVHTQEGTYNLKTDNIPFITNLVRAMQRFESEHKVQIYYFWRTQFVNQKWGTATPVTYNDPVYNFPVKLRAHGNFSFAITDPKYFFQEVVGGVKRFAINDARNVIMQRFVEPLADLFAESGFSYAQIDSNRDELSLAARSKINSVFAPLGFEMTDFRIEGTTFDEDTQRRIGRIADITAEQAAAVAANMNYAQLQQLEALRDAAKNEGGAAGAGVSLGAGVGLGQALMGSMQPQPAPTQQSSQPTLENRLLKLKSLLDQGLINQEDFEKRKNQILSEV